MQTAPTFIYGTAWKEDRTAGLVTEALAAGFRAIDTANQRKHYHEVAVGEALAGAGVARGELWLQSKFTSRDGQDHRLPYDERAPVAAQVAQSLASSLEHLHTTYLDSFVLHGPTQREGWSAHDREAWAAMERAHDAGLVRALGVSNVTAAQVEELIGFARVAPAAVQNRCYADRGWDRATRAVCTRHGLAYQAFSLLTANRAVVAGPVVGALAEQHGRTPAQIVFRFAQQLGMTPLTGTSSSAHMAEDLVSEVVTLAADEVAALERVAG